MTSLLLHTPASMVGWHDLTDSL